VATKKVLVVPKGKKKPTRARSRFTETYLIYIPIADGKDLEKAKTLEDLPERGYTCREELIREISDNMTRSGYLDNSLMGFSSSYTHWDNNLNRVVSSPLMNEKQFQDFKSLMDIFVGGIGSAIAPLKILEACGPRKIQDCTSYDDKVIVYRGLPQPIYLHNSVFVSYFAGAARLCCAIAKMDKANLFLTMRNVALAKAAITRASAQSRKRYGLELIDSVRPIMLRNFYSSSSYVPSSSNHFAALKLAAKELPANWGRPLSISYNWSYEQMDMMEDGFSDASDYLIKSINRPKPKKKASSFLYY
jgi:hypothetical protein